MIIAVTGASGFVGKALTNVLEQAGHTIMAVPRKLLADDSVKELSDFIRNADAVINLAGEPIVGRWNKEKRENIYNSRIISTRNLVTAINSLEKKPEVLISTSASGFYKTDIVADEESENDEASFLGVVCRDWEAEAHKVNHEVRLVVTRFSIILGKSGGMYPKIADVMKKGIKVRFGSGDQILSWIHIDDLANLFVLLLSGKTEAGVYNCVAPDPVMMDKFIDEIGKYIHTKFTVRIPELILKIILIGGEQLFTGSLNIVSRKLSSLGFKFKYENIDKALKELATSQKEV